MILCYYAVDPIFLNNILEIQSRKLIPTALLYCKKGLAALSLAQKNTIIALSGFLSCCTRLAFTFPSLSFTIEDQFWETFFNACLLNTKNPMARGLSRSFYICMLVCISVCNEAYIIHEIHRIRFYFKRFKYRIAIVFFLN